MSKHVWFKTEIVSLVSAEFISWVFSLQGRKERIYVEQLFANPYEKSCVEKVKINFDMYWLVKLNPRERLRFTLISSKTR